MMYLVIIKEVIKDILLKGLEFLKNHWKAMLICSLGVLCFMLFNTNYILNVQIDNLETENKILADTIAKAKKWDVEKTKIVDEHNTNSIEIAKREEGVIATLDELQRKTEEKLKDQATLKDEEIKEVKKSHSDNVINSVWGSYCRNNPNKKGC